jgi:hypothetical protein
MAARSAIARRAFADSRARNISFALLCGLVAYASPAGYRHSYTTLQERLSFARSFGDDKAVRLFYGAVSLAFVWELFGALLGAPSWTLDLSPFHYVGLVPAQPFRSTAAIVMLAGAALAMLAARACSSAATLTGS